MVEEADYARKTGKTFENFKTQKINVSSLPQIVLELQTLAFFKTFFDLGTQYDWSREIFSSLMIL